MNSIAAIGLDIAAVSIVGYCMCTAAKKGFLRTIVQMIAYVVILLAASFFSRAVSPVLYDRVVEPMLLEKIQQDGGERQNAALISAVPQGLLSASGSWDAGELLQKLLKEGLTPELQKSLEELLPEGVDPADLTGDLAKELADAALRPVAISAIGMVVFALTAALLTILVNLLLSALGVINHVPVIGSVNGLLGGCVGVLQGLVLTWLLAVLLQGLLHLYPGGVWIFTRAAVEESFIFKYFANPGLLQTLRLP